MSKSETTNFGNKEIFARNLKRYMKMMGRTQKDLAQAVKVSSGTASDWANARIYPRMDKIQEIADFLDISKSDLVEDVNITKETVSNEDQRVLDLFHKVPKEKRELVLSMIRAAIDNL